MTDGSERKATQLLAASNLQAPTHCRRKWPHPVTMWTRCSPNFRKCGDDAKQMTPGAACRMGGMPANGRCFPWSAGMGGCYAWHGKGL